MTGTFNAPCTAPEAVHPCDGHQYTYEAAEAAGVFIVSASDNIDRSAMQALYELPDEKVTPEEVMALADSVEADIQGGPAGRPLLAVPHILADDTSSLPARTCPDTHLPRKPSWKKTQNLPTFYSLHVAAFVMQLVPS